MKYKKIIISAIIIILLIILSIILFIPKIYLADDLVKLELKDKYVEPGYKAYSLGFNITDKVIVDNNINNKKIGNYKVNYKIKFLMFNFQKSRIVKVIDSEIPNIEIKGNKDVIVCPNTQYTEDGYTAIDNYDGDITDNVIVKKEEKEIIYSVKDSYGNIAIKKRNLIIEDKEGPQIILKGGSNINIKVGNQYQENYQAIDNCDGDITNKVIKEGEVNPNRVGTYTITYKVKDSAGNETLIKRVVNVTSNKNYNGIIYLTFDDGPSIDITSKLLDILKSENVKATFFVINKSDSINYLIKRAYDEGHTIGLHSYTHDYKIVYSSNNAYIDDINKINQKVKKIIGKDTKIIRFPGGSSNTISKRYTPGVMSYLTIELTNRGYRYFDWNVDSNDAGGAKTSQEVYNNVTTNLKNNRANVVLMHDFTGNTKTLNALKDIIHYGKNNGYSFSSLDMSSPNITHRVTN